MVKKNITVSDLEIQQYCLADLYGVAQVCVDDSGDGLSCYNGGQQSITVECLRQKYPCNNTLIAEPCEAKYYCPKKSDKEPCQRGFYCPEGSVRQTACVLGAISCPRALMEYPDEGITFVVLCAVFIGCLLIHSYFAKKVLEHQEHNLTIATSQEATVLTRRKLDYIRSWTTYTYMY